MNLIRKKAPGRWARAIVTLAARTGNKLLAFRDNNGAAGAVRAQEFNPAAEEEGHLRLSERTTITVETERLLIVRSELRSSRTHGECLSEDRPPSLEDAETNL